MTEGQKQKGLKFNSRQYKERDSVMTEGQKQKGLK